MTFPDKVTYHIASLGYTLGTLLARLLLFKVGAGSRIHISVRYWRPSHIWVGENCEVRHGTFLDARSAKKVAIRVGSGSRIKDYVGLAAYGGEIQIGNNVLIGRCSTIFGHGGVFIGAYTMIGPHTSIISSNHVTYLSDIPFQDQGFTREPIYIGENVWIGAHTSILAGTTIAPNIVIGSGSIVRGNLMRERWLYAGVPAKPIKPLDTSLPKGLKIYHRNWRLLD